jgi:hypothetical protein
MWRVSEPLAELTNGKNVIANTDDYSEIALVA